MPGHFVTVISVLLILLASSSSLAWASSPPEYKINVTTNAVSVSITLTLFQNLTAYKTSFSLPQVHALLEGTNSTSAAQGVQNALQAKSPGAQVSNLRLEVDSTAWSNATSLQWFNISLSMEVRGVSSERNGVAQTDLSWKSFGVPTDISLGGVEVNNVGQKLLLKVAGDLAGQKSSNPNISFLFFVNDQEISAPQFPMVVGGLSTLNFSSFSVPLSAWKEVPDPLAQTITWTLSPGRSWGMRFVLRAQTSAGPENAVYTVLSRITGTITTPTPLSVKGDTIVLSANSFLETLMGTIILSISFVGLGATIYERRILKKPVRKKTKS